MALVVEDGSGVEGANAYLDAADFKAYADARGMPYEGKSDDEIEQALIRATGWLDATYRSRWPGVRLNGRAQALAWPRSDAADADGEEISDDEIPQEVLDATAEAAFRELTEPGSLSPDLERGGAIRRLKAGSVEVEYATTASARTTFTTIDGVLAGLLIAETSSGYTAMAVRA
ncbi:DnaT-like ssDNA-binding protein [Tardiphaga sp. 839_C3_N1_4]|uniref:DnaT-like ssDNA-binding protein n=1 Tax=Tardiphaga sp. 839_C3_N1_4 TaxID=3240761 RepID=UPI003F263BB0